MIDLSYDLMPPKVIIQDGNVDEQTWKAVAWVPDSVEANEEVGRRFPVIDPSLSHKLAYIFNFGIKNCDHSTRIFTKGCRACVNYL